MVTQEDADKQAEQLGDIRSEGGRVMQADAFGRIAYEKYCQVLDVRFVPWAKLSAEAKRPWIAVAEVVRVAEQKLVKEMKP